MELLNKKAWQKSALQYPETNRALSFKTCDFSSISFFESSWIET